MTHSKPRTQVLRRPTGFFNEPILELGQVEITDNYFGVLQAVVIHQILQLQQEPGLLKWPKIKCLFFKVTNRGSSAVYLQIAVDDIEGVQVRHSLHHLANHVAGVLLGVVALIQDPIKHLSACSTESETKKTCDGIPSRKLIWVAYL